MDWYLKCLRQYADFNGRARRKEYWMFVLFNIIFAIVAGIIDGIIGLNLFSIIYPLVVLIPGLAVAVRRLHDIGKSGWYYLLILIPIIGFIIILIWFCREGETTTNQWGENPKQ
ncbi:MAG: DUF805 domain-containing protein [Bacteroidales bacterium]|nr:DUF805 domain-containing protein [Bacteroidales bacterium]